MRARRNGEVLFGSAGWLFADLMLALVLMLFLATVVSASNEPTEQAASTVTPTTTTTPPPTTTTTKRPPRLVPDPVSRNVHMDTEALLRNDRGAIIAMRQRVRAMLTKPLGGRRAGIVLTFGSAPSTDIQRGISVATHFNNQVLRALGGQFAGTTFRSYFQGGRDPSKISFDVFVYDS
jgi:hypothetical protein